MASSDATNSNNPLIAHLDMDCFFAAVEMRDNPSLTKIPLAIGGESTRGVICTANYAARVYGVGSAMSGEVARKLCPSLKFLPVDSKKYVAESKKIFSLVLSFFKNIKQVSLDEAYIYIDKNKYNFYQAEQKLKQLQIAIKEEIGLECSIGLSYLQYLAKIASDLNKPFGFCSIDRASLDFHLNPLKLSKIPGVGPIAQAKLNRLGLNTIKDVKEIEVEKCKQLLGDHYQFIINKCYGQESSNPNKKDQDDSFSISCEDTFEDDLYYLDEINNKTLSLINKLEKRVANRLKKISIQNDNDSLVSRLIIKNLFLKYKTHDFKNYNVSKAMDSSFFSNIFSTHKFNLKQKDLFYSLLEKAYNRANAPSRLIGIGLKFQWQETIQSTLFND